jgi:hypothetical protein
MRCIAEGCNAEATSGNYCPLHRKKGATTRPGIESFKVRDVALGYAQKSGSKKPLVKKPKAKG